MRRRVCACNIGAAFTPAAVSKLTHARLRGGSEDRVSDSAVCGSSHNTHCSGAHTWPLPRRGCTLVKQRHGSQKQRRTFYSVCFLPGYRAYSLPACPLGLGCKRHLEACAARSSLHTSCAYLSSSSRRYSAPLCVQPAAEAPVSAPLVAPKKLLAAAANSALPPQHWQGTQLNG